MMINAEDLINWLNETEDETKESMRNSVRSDPFKNGALAAIQEIKEYVQKMEKIDQAAGITESKWIPCTEQPPKGEVLGCDRVGYMLIGNASIKNGRYMIEMDDDFLYCDAWMPLPEPYNERENISDKTEDTKEWILATEGTPEEGEEVKVKYRYTKNWMNGKKRTGKARGIGRFCEGRWRIEEMRGETGEIIAWKPNKKERMGLK